MPICWKFLLRSSSKPHLSIEREGILGSGEKTLCGLSARTKRGSVRTIKEMTGDECPRCAEKLTAAMAAPVAAPRRLKKTAA